MRQIVLDTETTGLFPEEGHRIIEIGCVELVDRLLTGRRFHVYLNPERAVDAGAAEVHGLTNEFLADKPLFADIADDFLAFVRGGELIIHNAPFDVGFIDHEFNLVRPDLGGVRDYCAITDTLALAKKKHPGQRNSLDALCKRYQVDNSHRDLHGALLDAEILAQLYLMMTGGQLTLALETDNTEPNGESASTTKMSPRPAFARSLRVIHCNDGELALHEARLDALDKAAGGRCLWRQ